MRARRKWILLLIGLMVAGAVAWNLTREREPVYQGKKLSEWLLIPPSLPLPDGPEYGVWLNGHSVEAVRAIGSAGLPRLLKWADYQPMPRWKIQLANFSGKLPAPLSRYKANAFESDTRNRNLVGPAFEAINHLGRDAGPAIPMLTRMAFRKGTEVIPGQRHLAILALASIGPEATPSLLSVYGSFPEERITVGGRLAVTLQVWNRNIVGAEYQGLADMRFTPVTYYFDNPDPLVREGATNFARDIAPRFLTNTSLLLSSNGARMRSQALESLGDVRNASTPALLRAYSPATEKDRFEIYLEIERRWPRDRHVAHGFIRSFFTNSDHLLRLGATNYSMDHGPWLLTNAPSR